MMAIGLTFLLIMQYMFPPAPPPEAPAAAPADSPAAPVQTAGAAPEVAEEARNFEPQGDFTVTVKVGNEGVNANGYEATFSSVGGGLSTYRLLGYFRVPMDASPENRIILLNRMAPGRDSLRVEEVVSGAAATRRVNNLRTARYELVEIPEGASVSPEPPAGVRRGRDLVFRTVAGEWELLRTYRFPGEGSDVADFTVGMNVEWRNISNASQALNYTLVGPAGLVSDDDSVQFSVIDFLTGRQPSPASDSVEIERKPIRELVDVRNMADRDNRAALAWVGAKNRFFTAVMTAQSSALTTSNGAVRRLFAGDHAYIPDAKDILDNLKHQPTVTTGSGAVPAFEEISLDVKPGQIEAGGTYTASYMLYAGPAADSFLAQADPRLDGVVHYSWSYLNTISRWMFMLLTFLDGILGNYGLAIIAMTIIIKMILHPLNRKSFISMNKMSKLTPMMKEIQKKYANDRQKMQLEMNKFYKNHGVSMAGGCLPMFLQLPIFLALYGAFSQGFSMRHAPFIPPWIKDLSNPDSILDLGFNIPLLNSSHLSLLPILYFVLNYIQMSMQPKPTDPQQAQQQKIMKFMPLMFVFIFYSMPAGLVLYFTVSALCGVAESTYMRKVVLPKLGLGDSPEAAETAAASVQAGTGAAAVPSDAKKKKKRK